MQQQVNEQSEHFEQMFEHVPAGVPTAQARAAPAAQGKRFK